MFNNIHRSTLVGLALAMAAAGIALNRADAAQIDLATVPVAGTGQAAPKPNVMLLMDTSQSMARTHMPDELEPTGQRASLVLSIGYRSSQCNSLYYDPMKEYTLPKNAVGVLQPVPSFSAARYNYYSTDTSTTDLSSQFRAYDRNTRLLSIANSGEDTPQPAYYYQFVPTSGGSFSLDYRVSPCTDMEDAVFAGADFTQSTIDRPATGGTWRRKRVTAISGIGPAGADERRNFAIWYTYYRTRMAMVKSAISLAFDPVTEKFRVGLVSMNPLNDATNANSGVAGSKYLPIDDFTSGQRVLWYSKLFEQVPNGSSPAREGLARVGRHYAGRVDGINTNMTPDPVSNSCQQNFTIMTTDGYWNTAQETVGPVGLDGTTRVGNTDGILSPKSALDQNNPNLYSHRPIWDGTTSGKRTDTDKYEQMRYAACDTGQFYKTTSIVRRSTRQTTQQTQGLAVSTTQTSMSTIQTSKSTTQTQQTNASETQQTFQNLASTQQTTRSTIQHLQTTRSVSQGTSTVSASTSQLLQTTSYTEKQQTTREAQTTQLRETVSRLLKSTSQRTRRTEQYRAATTQRLQTQTTYYRSTSTTAKSTSQVRMSTSRQFERTSQLLAYDGTTERAVPVASCTSGGSITCITLSTGPTAVASCTPQSPSQSNDYLTRTCDAPQTTGPTPVQSCSASGANSGNNFTTTTCDTATTGPTNVAGSSCTPGTAASSNSWTNTSCATTTSGETQTASCTPGTSGVTTTNCRAVTLAQNVPVQTCNSGTSGTTATTCTNNNTSATPVQSCAVGTTAATAPNWVTTTCTLNASAATGVSSCTDAAATASNNWTSRICDTVTTTNVATDACTATSASNSNSYTATTCDSDSTVAETNLVASCTAQTPTSANSYMKKACASTQSNWTTSAGCTDIAANSGNSYTSTACRDRQTFPPAPVLPANCTAGTAGAITTTCNPVVLTDVPSPSCAPNAAGPTFVSCRTATTGPTVVASCTPGGGANTNWVITTCQTTNGAPQNVAACTPSAASPGNGNVTTTCTPSSLTVGVPPGSCTPQTASSLNNWVTIECPAPLTTGPTPMALNSCTPAAPVVGNGYTQTTCATSGPTTPAPVASCTSGTGANFVVSTCSTNNSAVQAVMPGSCTDTAANSGNQWTRTVCNRSVSSTGVAANACTPVTPTAANGYARTTCAVVTTGPTFVPAGSCFQGTDANFLTTSCATVQTGPTLVAACTPGTDANQKVTSCSVATTGPTQLAPGTACVDEAASASNNWIAKTCTVTNQTVGVAGACVPSAPGVFPIITCNTVTTGPTPVAACDEGTDSNFVATSCSRETVGPERTSSCMAATPSAGNGYQRTSCDAVPGTKIQSKTRLLTTTYTVSGANVLENTAVAGTPIETDWADMPGGACYADPQRPPTIDTTAEWRRSSSGMPSGCTGWPCAGTIDTSTAVVGSLNSLADVAQYYYVTDLRPSASNANPDPWKNNVPKLGSGAEDDRAPWQHMTTFVMGLGVSGTLDYRADYRNGAGDFAKIRSYENTPALNWPKWPLDTMTNALSYEDPRSIDDFWHTAVNGRGRFFSAKDPQSVVDGLREALAGIEAQAGAGAGASTSTLTPVAGDNTAYTGSYTSSEWTGDLQAQDIDLSTGNLTGGVKWSARAELDLRTGPKCDNRKIYVRNPAGGALADFTWNTFACGTGSTAQSPAGAGSSALPADLRQYFNDTSALAGLSQWAFMNADQRDAVGGANLVNFIRGQRSYEGFVVNDVEKLYRSRSHILGDIVNSQPAYVKAPNLSYQDSGYDDFKTANAARTPMVYVGANDGMLHAFYAPAKTSDPNYGNAGREAWAFVPTAVMSKLWKLADTNYSERHIFTVDGSPISGDVFDATAREWKTILVGGLNGGGNGYYALDVTDPAAPKALWEFGVGSCNGSSVGATSDCNVGLSYGRPVITKLKSGKWVVIVTSGYNNTSASGSDGKGYLYVLDAVTGQIISRIGTGEGTSASPSGLREINFFVSNIAYDNTAQRVYGGDILGNVWRFDVNDSILPAGLEATLIGTTKDAMGTRQPITTRPELAEVNGNTMVIVGTGRLLSISDLTDTSTQSVYGIKDPMTATSPAYSDLRASLKPLTMVQTGSGASATRTVSCDATNQPGRCSEVNGWFIDLSDGGERINVDMQTVLGTLVFASNVPSDGLCVAGGYSWLNFVSVVNGEAVPSSEGRVVSVPFFENSLVVGLGLVGLSDGTIRALGRDNTGSTRAIPIPVGSPPPVGKRISWREITK